ncbi:MAG TPA: HEAT repeat domain-containing protein [Phycisphaerae bacterium]|nr:HEAT repeat domain-containing protein [Phycisphaerae bacterium]HRY68804.1 HEAT repeat domain-containing protein [Phycisphaerae bacterium]HSA27467.1 HEAT repeat domain-containing protein [Phycisphaerae bacterium]
MGRCCSEAGCKALLCLAWVGLVLVVSADRPAFAQDSPAKPEAEETTAQPAEKPEAAEPADKANETAPAEQPEAAASAEKAAPPAGEQTYEQHLSQYLHFALIGQFDIAASYGEAFLKSPEIEPLTPEAARTIIAFTDQNKNAIDTLLMIIKNTSIAESGRKVLDVIRQAHRSQRRDPARINENLKLLAGTPNQQETAIERLLDSGEYAVPWLLTALVDPAQKDLRPYIERALPRLGKRTLNPLLASLDIDHPVMQRVVVETLGKVGYPQSLPYLKRIATDAKANEAVRKAAVEAIDRLTIDDKDQLKGSVADLFQALAEQYYAELDSLLPDLEAPKPGTVPSSVELAREPVNVWVVDGDMVTPIEVQANLFALIMSMRCCEASLKLRKDCPEVVALWLAANFRREARMGLDVQTEEVVESVDQTRPKDYPRSVYFARMAGPKYCRLVLQRAVKDRDRDVALGAIAALNVTAGPNVMVDSAPETGVTLAAGLNFPDLLVRIRAASALARVRPQKPFPGVDQVVAILASALHLTGHKYYLVVDPDAASLKAVADGLAGNDVTVLKGDRLGPLLAKAHQELTYLDGVFLASDVKSPAVTDAIRLLAADDRFALVPIVMYAKESDILVLDQVAAVDRRVGRVLMVAEKGVPAPGFAKQLMAKRDQIAPLYSFKELNAEESTALALSAAAALRDMTINRSSVFDPSAAQQDLIDTLKHPSEPLRIAAAGVLGKLDGKQAQQAVAGVALASDQTPALRSAAFAALADSIRQFGSYLDADMLQRLVQVAFGEPNLELRTAASQAPGALNLKPDQVAELLVGGK